MLIESIDSKNESHKIINKLENNDEKKEIKVPIEDIEKRAWSLSVELEYYKGRSKKESRNYDKCGDGSLNYYFNISGDKYDQKVNEILMQSRKYIIVINLPNGFLTLKPIALISKPITGENWIFYTWGVRSSGPEEVNEIDSRAFSRLFTELSGITGKIYFGDETGSIVHGDLKSDISNANTTFITFGEKGSFDRCAAYGAEEMIDEIPNIKRKASKNYKIELNQTMKTIGNLLKLIKKFIMNYR